MADRLGILLITGSHERVHYAFMMACGAAAIGREVTLFATNEGCRGLLQNWSSLDGADRDDTIRRTGVAGLDELREAATDLGVRLLACQAGLLMAGLAAADLLAGVEVAGIPAFLSTAGTAIVTL